MFACSLYFDSYYWLSAAHSPHLDAFGAAKMKANTKITKKYEKTKTRILRDCPLAKACQQISN